MIQVLLTVDIMKFKLVVKCFNLMIMKKFLSIRCVLGVLFFALLATSCTEKVNLDPHERGIVVYAMMEDSTVQQVKLFYTSYPSETYYPPVEEAEVYMEKMEGDEAVERYDFHKKEDGLWEADLYPQQLAYYKLTVNVPGNDVITATTQFPLRNRFYARQKRPNHNNSQIISESISNFKDDNNQTAEPSIRYCARMLFSFMDYIPESKSYELATEIYRGTLLMPTHESWSFQACLFEDYECYVPYGIRRSMWNFTPHQFSNITDSNYIIPQAATFDYLEFIIDFMTGLVSANARRYRFGPGSRFECYHPLSYMLVRNVNEDFELYLKSVIAKNIGLGRKDISDLTHIWEKDEIYSNVKNGLGIFAAECRYELMVKDYVYTDIPPHWEEYNMIIPGWND